MAETTFHSITLPGQNPARVPLTAVEFSTSTVYKVRDYCTYQGKLYICSTAHAAGTWNAAHFTEVNVGDEINTRLVVPPTTEPASTDRRVGDLWIDTNTESPVISIDPQPVAGSTNVPQSGGTFNLIKNLDNNKVSKSLLTGDFSTSSPYSVNNLCIHNGYLYRCIVDIPTGAAWDASKWQATTIETELARIESEEVDLDVIAETFGDSSSYAVGDYVLHTTNGADKLYRCISAVSDTSVWNSQYWSEVKLADKVSDIEENQIPELKSAINEVVTFSPNLLDKENITRGKYLTSNNIEVTDENAFISDYFPCKPNEYFITKYSPYLGYGFIVVYDQSRQYIANINGWKDGNYSCYQAGSASNIAFARVSHQLNMLDNLMIVSGQEYPAVYSDYGENKILVKTLPDKLWLKVEAGDIADAVFMNLFDKATAIDGQYVESTNGTFSYSSIYWRSEFIPVKPNTEYRASGNNRVAFYDANKVYIEGYNSQYTYTSPTNASYIVVCNTPLDSKNTFVLAESANYTGEYYKYGVKIPWLIEDVPKSKYAGKNLVCFGDSITNYDYTATIKADTGIDAVNVGLSSGRYAYSDDSDQYVNAFAFHNIIYSISTGDWTIPDTLNGVSRYETQYAHIQDIKAINFNDVDFVSIAYGTNDFSSATPLDDADYPLDPEKSFKGAIRYCLKLLTEKYPHLKIIGVTPCYRFWSENETILYDSDEHAVGGLYLNQYVQAVEDVYTEYHLPVVNNYTNAGINKYNRLQYFSISDGLHPNANGRAVIGHRIGNGILANY